MDRDYYSTLSSIFKRHYEGLNDERYLQAERNYKVEIVQQLQQDLHQDTFKKYLDEEDYKELLVQLRLFFNQTRLTNWRDFQILRKHDLSLRPTLCHGLNNLLFSSDSLEDRIDSILEILNKENHVTPSNKWAFISYLLFFYFPKECIFVKPSAWTDICGGLGIEDTRDVTMTGASYRKILDICNTIIDSLKGTDLEPEDMIDLHSIFTICFK